MPPRSTQSSEIRSANTCTGAGSGSGGFGALSMAGRRDGFVDSCSPFAAARPTESPQAVTGSESAATGAAITVGWVPFASAETSAVACAAVGAGAGVSLACEPLAFGRFAGCR